jgi:HEAT repeat protein
MWESRETNPYAWCRQIPDKKIRQLIEVSSNVGDTDEKYWLDLLKDKDPAIRYWAVIGLQAIGTNSEKAISALNIAMQDSSPAVAISAASTILNSQNSDKALDVLGKYMLDDRPYVSLYASRCTELAGIKAKQLIPIMYEVLDKNKRKEGEPGNHKHYKDFEFASFTSWSLKYALHICGEDIDYSF